LFELLRFASGGFTFEADSTTPDAGRPAKVEPLLAEAEELMAEWKVIEAVVPSMDAWAALVAELPHPTVTLDPVRWRTVVAIGGGSTVWALGDVLNLSEVPLCRSLKELVELGIVGIGNNPATGGNAGTAHAHAAVTTDFDSARPAPSSFGNGDSAGSNGHEDGDVVLGEFAGSGRAPASEGLGGHSSLSGLSGQSLADTILIDSSGPTPTIDHNNLLPPAAFANAEPGEADEVARQLANLSPQAARAVAAAAQASTDEEREAALAAVNDEEEPINRGLLLKFLSSVRS
jgi:hypothetical protein